MLILTRRAQGRIIIDGGITITILRIRGNQVRVGIDAPRNIAVHREEVVERQERAARRADQGGS